MSAGPKPLPGTERAQPLQGYTAPPGRLARLCAVAAAAAAAAAAAVAAAAAAAAAAAGRQEAEVERATGHGDGVHKSKAQPRAWLGVKGWG